MMGRNKCKGGVGVGVVPSQLWEVLLAQLVGQFGTGGADNGGDSNQAYTPAWPLEVQRLV
jgi:hypothetical protein